MTRDETEAFLDTMNASVESGSLPELNDLTPDQKDMLLRSCKFIDTPGKRRAVAALLAEMQSDRDIRAFSIQMKISRFVVVVRDFGVAMWSIPGAVVVVLVYLATGGDKQAVINLITGLIK